jgi:hypothetical protein
MNNVKPMKSKLFYRCTFEMNVDIDHDCDEMIRLICNHDRGGHDTILPQFALDQVNATLRSYLIEEMKLRNIKSPF